MKQLKLFLFIALLLSVQAKAQLAFQRCYNLAGYINMGRSSVELSDGSLVMCIYTQPPSAAGGLKTTVLKISPAGSLLWSKTLGNGIMVGAWEMIKSSDEKIIIVGNSMHTAAGNSGVSIIKMDTSGQVLWSKYYGSSSETNGYSILETNDLGYFVAGTGPDGNLDMLALKTDSAGNVQWMKSYGDPVNENAVDAVQDSSGDFIVAGFRIDDYVNVTLSRFSSSGNLNWSKVYPMGEDCHAVGVDICADRGFVICCEYRELSLYNQVLVIRTDSAGAVLWAKRYTKSNFDIPSDIMITPSSMMLAGKTFVAGVNDGFLIKTDLSGNIIWSKEYDTGDNETFNQITRLQNGGFLVSGYTNHFFSGSASAYIIRTDSTGFSSCNEAAGTFSAVSIPCADSLLTLQQSGLFYDTTLSLQVTNGISVQDICIVGTGDEIEFSASVSVFPVPASSVVTIESEHKPFSQLKIFGADGRLISSKKFAPVFRLETNTNNLSAGIYFFEISGADVLCRKKIIIQQ